MPEANHTADYAKELVIKRCEDLADAISSYLAMLPDIGGFAHVLRAIEANTEYCVTVMRGVK